MYAFYFKAYPGPLSFIVFIKFFFTNPTIGFMTVPKIFRFPNSKILYYKPPNDLPHGF